jgi:RND family efflux transporter MFP subunit
MPASDGGDYAPLRFPVSEAILGTSAPADDPTSTTAEFADALNGRGGGRSRQPVRAFGWGHRGAATGTASGGSGRIASGRRHAWVASWPLAALASLPLTACASKKAEAPPTPLVAVSRPLQKDVVDWDDYVGRFEAVQDVQVRPRVSGQITKIAFREGVEVKPGQFLFEIDPRPFQAALNQAKGQEARAAATFANARTERARAAALLEARAVSQEEFDQKVATERSANADLEAARANVEARALDLQFTTVRSPISGRISDKRVSIGDFVTAGQTVLTRVVSVDPIWFSFDGAENFYLKYIRQAERGERQSSRYAANPVDIKLADESSYRWHGRMSFVDNAIDKTSGTIRAHAVVANPDGFLVPGMFGRARLLGSGAYHALLIPDEAIVTDQARRTVFVVGPGGKVASRNVETGPLVMGLRVIKSGLRPEDDVVLDGLTRLKPGATVKTHPAPIHQRAADDAPTAVAIETPPALEATVR